MRFRTVLATFAMFSLMASAAGSAATSAERSVVRQLVEADVLIGRAAKVTPAERRDLKQAAAQLRASGKPTKLIVRGEAPGNGREYARQIRDELGPANNFTGTVMVLWQRPRRGLGIAGPYPQQDGQRVFDELRPVLQRDPIAGMIAIAKALPDATTEEPLPAEDDAFPPPDGFPFTDTSGGDGGGLPLVFGLAMILGVALAIIRGVAGQSGGWSSGTRWSGRRSTFTDSPTVNDQSNDSWGSGSSGGSFGGASGGDIDSSPSGGSSSGSSDSGGGNGNGGGSSVGGASGGDF